MSPPRSTPIPSPPNFTGRRRQPPSYAPAAPITAAPTSPTAGTSRRLRPSCSIRPKCRVNLKMSRNNGKGPKLDLRLSFSRSRGGGGGGGGGPSAVPPPGGSNSPRRMSSSSSSSASPPSSCVSSEGSPEAGGGSGGSAMILAGCPRCMMYVMLSREDPKCPKCHSTVLLDFNDDHRNAAGFGSGKVGKGKRG
ncbi:hypothetical protein D1007_09986 [Hordeum vulgare]|nr:hypothetical protein D1007_09986 [Hordeum vulgare]